MRPWVLKRGHERTQDLYSGLYSEKGRSWVSEKRSQADSGPLFWTLQWKREVLSLWKELLRVSHFLKLLRQKPPLFLHHGEQCAPPQGAAVRWLTTGDKKSIIISARPPKPITVHTVHTFVLKAAQEALFLPLGSITKTLPKAQRTRGLSSSCQRVEFILPKYLLEVVSQVQLQLCELAPEI